MEHILIVDDEKELAWAISQSLSFHGYTVSTASNGFEALRQIEQKPPNLIILDIIMPRMDGIDLCQRIRSDPDIASIPIIFLTACSKICDKITAFETGADDYLVKPFDTRELIVRIRAVLRRYHIINKAQQEERQLQVGKLHLNLDLAHVEIGSQRIQLTPIECDLLKHFMHNPGRLFSSDELLQEVWDYPPRTGDPASVRWHIKNLRRKIEPSPSKPIFVRTIPRHGYMLSAG